MDYPKSEQNRLGLNDLLSQNQQAKDYFMSLGEGGMGKLRQSGELLASYEDMVDKARQTPY